MATYSLMTRKNTERAKKMEMELNSKINEILIFDKDIPSSANLTFVDFAANYGWKVQDEGFEVKCYRGDPTSYPDMKRYCDVVERANLWLKDNVGWRCVGCETVNSLMRITDDIMYKNSDDRSVIDVLWPLTSFRLWLKKRDELEFVKKEETIIQRIKYLDFTPEKINDNEFEDLDSVMKKINEKIKNEEIEGKIMNIQTHLCTANDKWDVDPEDTYPIDNSGKYVFIIRVFFEIGPPCEDEIGFMDFVPECQKSGHIFSAPKFESQLEAFKRCSFWLSENPEIIFINAQTIEYKIKGKSNVDAKCMSFSKYNGGFIRMIRVAYRKPPEIPDDIPQTAFQPPPPPLYMASKIVVLDRSDHKHDDVKLTNISISKNIVAEYFDRREWNVNEAYKWKFLNIETSNVFAETDREFESRLNESYRHCRAHESQTNDSSKMVFYIAIVYTDVGYYGKEEIDTLRTLYFKRKRN